MKKVRVSITADLLIGNDFDLDTELGIVKVTEDKNGNLVFLPEDSNFEVLDYITVEYGGEDEYDLLS